MNFFPRCFAGIFLFLGTAASAADCGLEPAEKAFQSDTARAVSLIRPPLVNAVNDCFNPENANYIQGAQSLLGQARDNLVSGGQSVHASFVSYQAQVQIVRAKALGAAAKAGGQGSDVESLIAQDAGVAAQAGTFASSVDTAKASLDGLVQQVKSKESNLTSYGFTTSDRTDNSGNFRYPNCNSKKNDKPADSWKQFLTVFYSLPGELARVKAAVLCQKNAIGGLGQQIKGSSSDFRSLQ
jgi:hypothetical protein